MAIRALREAAGLKQFELAALMNIKPASACCALPRTTGTGN
ncbi:hypothetical protein SDC9_93147 [bioreactor metagenome]|uniref:Uncharacterized protein n=1 Tax=bioreactor metagenome TaxID=1076179 RepID=A0A645A078_9ZZZZ|nr:hypothetical protein [Oscillibacter sp.]MEA4994715.1 hypothetical protein [Oscillibacter sp.]